MYTADMHIVCLLHTEYLELPNTRKYMWSRHFNKVAVFFGRARSETRASILRENESLSKSFPRSFQGRQTRASTRSSWQQAGGRVPCARTGVASERKAT